MSTMSSATASGRDWAPSDKSNFKNQMCLFIVTRPDDTLFDATSMSEEDIVEICIKLGHTHPMGVLCYSATESVALFCSTEDMQCATHRAIKAMMLWDKAIAIRAMAPLEIYIKAYVRAVGRGSLKLQSPCSEEEGEPIHPLTIPTPVGQLCIISKQSLVTLLITNCINSWRISNRRSQSVNWMHPPVALHQCHGETHQGMGIPMWMTRSPFQEGEVGSPGATIPISSPSATRWGMGSYGTISSTIKSCST